ncbi:hypothetical protein AVEN_177603-1 [Araneus ventricosus]|uniref:Uncharacterized protein n=1 Tax=Araneus ventricosus TaxID=182803 RepID=A0A4Y2EMA8_ARAVE|nr:hypothetical protein AVEN_177603-1 [Araneus ventricosus]
MTGHGQTPPTGDTSRYRSELTQPHTITISTWEARTRLLVMRLLIHTLVVPLPMGENKREKKISSHTLPSPNFIKIEPTEGECNFRELSDEISHA